MSLEDCLGAPLQLIVATRKEKCWRVIIRLLGWWGLGLVGCGVWELSCFAPPRIGRLIVKMGVGMSLKKAIGVEGQIVLWAYEIV